MSAPPPGDGGEPGYDGPPAWGPPDDGEPLYPQYPPGQYPAQPYGSQPYQSQPHQGQPYGEYHQTQYAGAPPQHSGRGNLIAVLVAAAVVAVAVLVAVIVLQSGNDDAGPTVAAPSGPTAFPSISAPSLGSSAPAGIVPTGVPTGPGADAVSATLTGIRFFTLLTTHDLGAATALACPGARLGLTQAKVDQVGAALPSGAATTGGSAATMNGTLARTDGSRSDLSVHMRHSGADWCVDRVSGL
ncbi:hypothetical protein [uncultured Jatrophihabitans sp.]|uniref:hypothetical protein n=1 Tax=uncultured Jatrophihabitans sp. TaxID=1610747 RepID=UPI0035CA0596